MVFSIKYRRFLWFPVKLSHHPFLWFILNIDIPWHSKCFWYSIDLLFIPRCFWYSFDPYPYHTHSISVGSFRVLIIYVPSTEICPHFCFKVPPTMMGTTHWGEQKEGFRGEMSTWLLGAVGNRSESHEIPLKFVLNPISSYDSSR
jgi:hypothetical protein